MLEQRRSWAAVLCWLTVMLEGFDLVTLGATSLALRNADTLQLTPERLTLVATLSLVGVAIGAAFVAPLADVFGRRRVLLGSVVVFSVLTILQPLSPNVAVFAGLRLLAGLGLGACMPVALATMSESVPVNRRARASTTTMTGYHAGAVAASLLALAVTDSWQVLYYAGGIAGLVLTVAMWRMLPETAAVGEPVPEGEKVTVLDLLKGGRLRITLAVWVSTFMGLLLVYGLNTWLPNLMREAGYSVSTSVTLLLVLNAGGIAGMLLAGYMADTRGVTRTVLAWFAVGGVLLASLSIKIESATLLNVIIFLTGVFVFSAQVLVYAYVAHTHPQRIRGSALGITSGVGRIGAIVGPTITGAFVSAGIARPWGFYFFALAAFLGLAAMAIAPHVGRVGSGTVADRAEAPPAAAARSCPFGRRPAQIGRRPGDSLDAVSEQLRVAVVGGGVLGTSTAAQLAARGVRVVLVTDAGMASGASGRSLSWLNSAGPYPAEYHRLRMLGIERYRTFAARPGSAAHIRFDGGLCWGDGVRTSFERQQEIGYPGAWLTPEDVALRVPGVDPAAVSAEGALLNPDEGWVDLPSLIGQLVRDLVAAGGEVRAAAGRCQVVVDGDRVTGVRTGDGDVVGADAVVLATGAAVPEALDRLGVPVSDATTNALLVRTSPFDHRLRAVLNTPRVAVRPAPGGGLVLDAGWAEEEVVTRDDGSFEVRA